MEHETDLSDRERSDRFLVDIVEFGQKVMAVQLANVRREETQYNKHAFDWACDGFLVGAMMSLSEQYSFPTSPRDRASLGLIAYLTKCRGYKFEQAQERAATLYHVPEGSKGALLFKLGYGSWQDPEALKVYFRRPPDEVESQAWADRMDRRRRWLIWGAAAIALAIAAFAAGYYVRVA